jgi:crotonobetainyl-CoA:carnitine CoA-transferase CaiB-like acyl-CoA transferase
MCTLDGFIAMAPVSEANFRALTRAANSPHWLEDPRFVTREKRIGHWQAFLDVIELWTRTISSADAESALAHEGCPASAYRSIADAQVDPQVRARGSAVDVEDASGTFQVANCPIKFTDAIACAGKNVPELGEHAEEVLVAAGYSTDEIKALRGANVII